MRSQTKKAAALAHIKKLMEYVNNLGPVIRDPGGSPTWKRPAKETGKTRKGAKS
jgi:hypothetical protein